MWNEMNIRITVSALKPTLNDFLYLPLVQLEFCAPYNIPPLSGHSFGYISWLATFPYCLEKSSNRSWCRVSSLKRKQGQARAAACHSAMSCFKEQRWWYNAVLFIYMCLCLFCVQNRTDQTAALHKRICLAFNEPTNLKSCGYLLTGSTGSDYRFGHMILIYLLYLGLTLTLNTKLRVEIQPH